MIIEGDWEEGVKLPLFFYTLVKENKNCKYPR